MYLIQHRVTSVISVSMVTPFSSPIKQANCHDVNQNIVENDLTIKKTSLANYNKDPDLTPTITFASWRIKVN